MASRSRRDAASGGGTAAPAAAGRPASLAELRRSRAQGSAVEAWALRAGLAGCVLAVAAGWAWWPTALESHEHYSEAARVLRNDGLSTSDPGNVAVALELVSAALRTQSELDTDARLRSLDPRAWPPICSRLGRQCEERPAGALEARRLPDGSEASLQDLGGGRAKLWLVDGLASQEELAVLLRKVEGLDFAASPTNHEQGQDWRSSSTSFLSREDPDLAPILARAAALCGVPVSYVEPPQVVRYRPGERYQPHMDSEGEHHRHWTLLLYLNDPGGGGATSFPLLGLKVLPAPGVAVFWNNLRSEPSVGHLVRDYRTLHDGQAPTAGEPKLALNIWVRAAPYSAP